MFSRGQNQPKNFISFHFNKYLKIRILEFKFDKKKCAFSMHFRSFPRYKIL